MAKAQQAQAQAQARAYDIRRNKRNCECSMKKSKIFIITSKFKMFHNQQFVINTMFFSEYCSARKESKVKLSVSALCMNHFLEERNKEKRKITEYKFEWQWKYNAASERSSLPKETVRFETI